MKEVKPKWLKKLMKFLSFSRRNQNGFLLKYWFKFVPRKKSWTLRNSSKGMGTNTECVSSSWIYFSDAQPCCFSEEMATHLHLCGDQRWESHSALIPAGSSGAGLHHVFPTHSWRKENDTLDAQVVRTSRPLNRPVGPGWIPNFLLH